MAAWPTWPWFGRASPEGFAGFLVERGTPGYSHQRYSRQVVHAGLGDFQPLAGRIAASRKADRLPGARGLKAAALLPFAGALRHRLGRYRRGHGLL